MLNPILKSILFFSLWCNKSYGQNDSVTIIQIDNYVTTVDTSRTQIDSFLYTIDSIQVGVTKYINKVVTKSFFTKSKTYLTVNLYLKDGDLIFAKAVEQSKKFKALYRYCSFYFHEKKIIFQDCKGTRQLGIAIPSDGRDAYGYNENLTFEFVRNYVKILNNRLKNYR